MKCAVIKGDNNEVIEFYYSIIIEALEQLNIKAKIVEKGNFNSRKFDIVLISTIMQSLFFKRKCKCIYWAQGVEPEESYMRNHSKFRLFVLGLLEKRALKMADFLLFVSNEQRKHYEKKYQFSFKPDPVIMPCFNEQINPLSFESNNKYNNNAFCYVGSLAVWQCFEETVIYYKRLEEIIPNAEFRVFTKDIDKASVILKRHEVQRYHVEYVEQSQLNIKLAECKFGFILRKDYVVNNIATPTKLSNYLSNGVIPIFSDCISSFNDLAKKYQYLIPISKEFETKRVLEYANSPILSQDVYFEFSQIFNTYYNRDVYIKILKTHFSLMLS